MSADQIVTGRIIGRHLKAPKTHKSGRTCTHDSCATKLSRYNRNTTCWLHAPTRYPRTRGRVTGGTP